MSVSITPPPIPGTIIDPPPKSTPSKVQEVDERSGAVGVVFGVGYRFEAEPLTPEAERLVAADEAPRIERPDDVRARLASR